MINKCIYAFLFLATTVFFSNAQPLTIQWQKCLGGTYGEVGYSIKQTGEGGYLIAGEAVSNDGDVIGNHNPGQPDGWVVKLDSAGDFIWQKCYGGSDGEIFYSLELSGEHDFVVAGVATSVDGDVIGSHNPGDCWVLKCDSGGIIIWQRCIGGSDEEEANDIIKTYDNGFLVIGWTRSTDFDAVGRHDSSVCHQCQDVLIAKLDSTGTIEWSKCYGGFNQEEGNAIIQTSDSGFVFAGYTRSDNGDVQGLHGTAIINGYKDFWIVKINSAGVMQWKKCYGGSYDETPYDIISTQDKGFLVTGITASNDFDVIGNHAIINYHDVWIVKLDSLGNLQWQKCLGGSWTDVGRKALQLSDGGYVVLGYTESTDGDLLLNPPSTVDVWLLRLDQTGNIIWQQCLGGSNIDGAYDMQITNDGGCVFTGLTASNDGDVSGNHGQYDMWVVKLAPLPDGAVGPINPITDFAVYQNNISNTLGLSFYCNGNEHVKVQLLDLTGRILLQQPLAVSPGFNKKQIQTGNISAGIYLVRLITDGVEVTKKLAVE